jgi:HAD superfamily hydrolase (TIGR01509 family)
LIEAVIFDCDGVLVDSEVLALEVELAALAEIGLDYDQAEFAARFMGMNNLTFFEALSVDCRARKGHDLPEGFAQACHARYRAAFTRLGEVPGAGAAISSIVHRKAVASSSEGNVLEEKLRRTGLWDLFTPHIYSTDLVRHAKPAPDIFLHAAQALNAQPVKCVALEDSSNGVRAARAAGMRVWGFLGGGHMDAASGERLLAAGAERVVADWPEAATLLESA